MAAKARQLQATSRGSPPRPDRGFGFVELLVWIAIAALVAGLGASVLGPFAQERRLQAAVDRVAAALEYARELARDEARPVHAHVVPASAKTDGDRVRLTYADTSAVLHPVTRAKFEIDFARDRNLTGIHILASRAGGGHTLVFDRRGEPVETDGRFVLGLGTARLQVHVEPYSGRVVVGPVTKAEMHVELP